MFLCHFIGEAIPEIERGWANAFSPLLVSPSDPACRRRSDRYDLKTESVDQVRYLLTDVAPAGYDERFGHGAGGNEEVIFGFERGDAGVSPRLVQNDRHQRGGVDGDHPGSPSS